MALAHVCFSRASALQWTGDGASGAAGQDGAPALCGPGPAPATTPLPSTAEKNAGATAGRNSARYITTLITFLTTELNQEGSLLAGARCDQYLSCALGRWTIQNCSSGLHWDNSNKVCNFPAAAGCVAGGGGGAVPVYGFAQNNRGVVQPDTKP